MSTGAHAMNAGRPTFVETSGTPPRLSRVLLGSQAPSFETNRRGGVPMIRRCAFRPSATRASLERKRGVVRRTHRGIDAGAVKRRAREHDAAPAKRRFELPHARPVRVVEDGQGVPPT